MPALLSIESLETDRQFVERQLAEVHDVGWGTARLMWNNRLQELDQRIAEAKAKHNAYASVALIFDGVPVIGQGDIRLDFSTDALISYQKLVAAILAAQRGEDLPDRGPIKGADKARLFIRDLVRGSMGFVLEEIAPTQEEMVATPLKDAVEGATALIETLADPSEGKFDDTLATTQPRLIAAVQRFAKVLHDAGATTRIVGDEHRVALGNDEVALLASRLNEVEVEEEERVIEGTLLGILPDSHQFELRLPGEHGETLKGAVADELALKYLADQDFMDKLLLKPVRAFIVFTSTSRNGRLVKENRVLRLLEPDTAFS